MSFKHLTKPRQTKKNSQKNISNPTATLGHVSRNCIATHYQQHSNVLEITQSSLATPWKPHINNPEHCNNSQQCGIVVQQEGITHVFLKTCKNVESSSNGNIPLKQNGVINR